jgi:hypothetical protein
MKKTEMKTPWAPGPWKSDCRTGAFAIYEANKDVNCFAGLDDTAIVYQNGRGDFSEPNGYRYLTNEQIANASLLALAPEMAQVIIAWKRNAYINSKAWEIEMQKIADRLRNIGGLNE